MHNNIPKPEIYHQRDIKKRKTHQNLLNTSTKKWKDAHIHFCIDKTRRRKKGLKHFGFLDVSGYFGRTRLNFTYPPRATNMLPAATTVPRGNSGTTNKRHRLLHQLFRS